MTIISVHVAAPQLLWYRTSHTDAMATPEPRPTEQQQKMQTNNDEAIRQMKAKGMRTYVIWLGE